MVNRLSLSLLFITVLFCHVFSHSLSGGMDDLFKPLKNETAKRFRQSRIYYQDDKPGDLWRTGDSDNLGIGMCFYCDQRCEDQLGEMGFSDANSYFAQIVTEMNPLMANLHEGIVMELVAVLMPHKVMEMSWMLDTSATTAVEELTDINRKFWQDSGLYNYAVNYNCDVDFYVVSDQDPAWVFMGEVDGIADMFQMCLHSFSTVKLLGESVFDQARLIAHETGHLFGIYHDGPMANDYIRDEAAFEPGQPLEDCADELADLKQYCVAEDDCGCTEEEQLGSGCVMNAVPGGNAFSECSKAYFNMWYCLSQFYPTLYSTACIGDNGN